MLIVSWVLESACAGNLLKLVVCSTSTAWLACVKSASMVHNKCLIISIWLHWSVLVMEHWRVVQTIRKTGFRADWAALDWLFVVVNADLLKRGTADCGVSASTDCICRFFSVLFNGHTVWRQKLFRIVVRAHSITSTHAWALALLYQLWLSDSVVTNLRGGCAAHDLGRMRSHVVTLRQWGSRRRFIWPEVNSLVYLIATHHALNPLLGWQLRFNSWGINWSYWVSLEVRGGGCR